MSGPQPPAPSTSVSGRSRALFPVVAKDPAVGVRVERVAHAEALRHGLLPGVLAAEAHGVAAEAVVGVPQRYDVIVAWATKVNQGEERGGTKGGVEGGRVAVGRGRL
jgi:hypothetical protein